MTREEQLIYCKQCDHGSFDPYKGIICKLTGDIADFENDCPDFTGDRSTLVFPSKEICKNKKLKSSKIKDVNLLSDIWVFLTKKSPGLTCILIMLSYLYFIGMIALGYNMFNPDMANIVDFGANFRSYTLNGQPWRLFTTLFVHSNMLQIVLDLIVLLGLGYVIEPMVSRSRFLYTIILSGVLAGLVNISLYFDSYNMGMSTSCMGLIGLYLFMFFTNKEIRKPSKKILISMLIILSVTMYFYFTGCFSSIVFWFAFMIGVLSGLTFFLIDRLKQYWALTILGHFTIVAVICMICYLYVATTAKQPDQYVRLMTEFSMAEQKALSVYRLPIGSSYSTKLKEVNEVGIPNWYLCLKKLDEIDDLDQLNPYLEKKNQLMKKYCRGRLKVFGFLVKAFETKTSYFDFKIKKGRDEVALLMSKIKLVDEMASSELYEMKGMKSPFLYIINDRVVVNLNRLNIDKVVGVEWIMDRYSIQQITNKQVKGIIRIRLKGAEKGKFATPVQLEEISITKRNAVRGVPNITGREFREKKIKELQIDTNILIIDKSNY